MRATYHIVGHWTLYSTREKESELKGSGCGLGVMVG